jgi:hypothetical protein
MTIWQAQTVKFCSYKEICVCNGAHKGVAVCIELCRVVRAVSVFRQLVRTGRYILFILSRTEKCFYARDRAPDQLVTSPILGEAISASSGP